MKIGKRRLNGVKEGKRDTKRGVNFIQLKLPWANWMNKEQMWRDIPEKN